MHYSFMFRVSSRRLLSGLLLAFGCGSLAWSTDAALSPDRENTILLRPSEFETLGPWIAENGFIRSSNIPGAALGGVDIPEAGYYHVWTRSRDFAGNQPGSRRYRLKIDGAPLARESGGHRHEGWQWEEVDTLELTKGVHAIEIEDVTHYYARAGGILFTRSQLDPSAYSMSALAQYHQVPVQAVRARLESQGEEGGGPEAAAMLDVVELRNPDVAIRIGTLEEEKGESALGYAIMFEGDDSAMFQDRIPPLLLLSKSRADIQTGGYFPAWKSDATEDWLVGERRISLPADPTNPFLAANLERLYPVAVKALSERSAKITWRSQRGLVASTTLTLPDCGHAFRMETTLEVGETADYSLAWSPVGEEGIDAAQIREVQLPPLFQYKRLPQKPQVLTSSVTPVPMALVEWTPPQPSSGLLTVGVLADPHALPSQWATRDNAVYGFSLMGPAWEYRPLVFSPVIGGAGSHLAAGSTLRASWLGLFAPMEWDGVMREANVSLYGVHDYREPYHTSLTEQALNIIDFIKDGSSFLWLDELKGPANIEDANTVTQASPLMLLAAAVLTRDPIFFEERSLPTLEYMLSRPSCHFSLEANSYVSAANTRLTFEQKSYGAGFWQGADALLGRLNPWIAQQARLPDGQARRTALPVVPEWADRLALYRLDPAPEVLAEIEAEAEAWLRENSPPKDTDPVGLVPFYNVYFYPYWWDMLDLYEYSGKQSYLDAARRFASQTVVGLWVHPLIPAPDAQRVLYPDDEVETTQHNIWWQGDHQGRLGWTEEMLHGAPRKFPEPEREVPAWLTSPVGLGLEQPVTYYNAGQPRMANIQLSVWAANLLRLAGATGDDFWRTYARNTIIGRGASYPGYYLSEYIDLMHKPDYPENGPDLTSFYWHHVPVHLAMLVDYLVTDAEVRTSGAIRFPYAKQEGYVWFASRIYGGEAGTVFDDRDCYLWLDREQFGVDTPKVDYLGARSRDRFHLIVLNQAQTAVRAPVYVDAQAIGIKAADGGYPARLVHSQAPQSPEMLTLNEAGRAEIELPRGGWAVLSFEARPDPHDIPAKPLPRASDPQTHPLGEPWGDMHAFRIRTPFDTDAVYVAFSGNIPEGSRAELLIDGSSEPAVVDAFAPYELTLYPLSQEETITFRVRLFRPDGDQLVTQSFTLPAK
jgi:hypothetical protein